MATSPASAATATAPVDVRVDLAAEADLVRARIAELAEPESAAPDPDAGFADAASLVVERDEQSATLSALEDHLAALDAAIARIDAGTYGTCERCDRPIGPARLEAIPTATRCITCAPLP